jgi:hypothetical protein
LAPSQKSSKGDRITSWSTGFDNLLNDSEGLRHFTTFLAAQYAAENIEFWQACQKCKKLGEAKKQKEMAHQLITTYEDFVQEQVINLDSGLTNEFKALMAIAKNEPESLSNNPLERQERHIYQLLKTDCYPRFLKSDIYKSIFTRENFEAGNKNKMKLNGELEAESENLLGVPGKNNNRPNSRAKRATNAIAKIKGKLSLSRNRLPDNESGVHLGENINNTDSFGAPKAPFSTEF